MVELDPDANVGQLKNRLQMQLMAGHLWQLKDPTERKAWFANRAFVIGDQHWDFNDDFCRFTNTGAVRTAIDAIENTEEFLQCTIVQKTWSSIICPHACNTDLPYLATKAVTEHLLACLLD